MVERYAWMRQTCWVCGVTGVPNEQPGWFALAFHPVGGGPPPWQAPTIDSHTLCPDHAQQTARFLEELKDQARQAGAR